MIHCAKCHLVNPADQRYCQSCRADLLPGEGLGIRLGVLLVSGLLSAVAVYVLLRINQGNFLPDLGCAISSPVFWGILAIFSPLMGISYAVRRTPPYQRYVNRAQRHTLLDPEQALADLTRALELAPAKEQAAIFKTRSELNQKLGLTTQATRDKIAYTESEGAYSGSSAVASLTGMDSDTYVGGIRTAEQEALLKAQEAIALGYCPKCKDVVLLDEKKRCKLHPRRRIQGMRLAVPQDEEKTRSSMRTDLFQKQRRLRMKNIAIAGFTLVAIGAYASRYLRSPASESATTPDNPAVGVANAGELALEATPSPLTFDDHGFSFQYPGDWQTISADDQTRLLNGSLKGLDASQAQYIGGVYLGGVGNCPGCAQIVIVVMDEPAMQGTFSDEQYASARQASQESMGDRLLEYNRLTVDALPAAESKYIGRSRESQNWDLIIVPPQAGQFYMFSMSASPEDYPLFEAQFQQAVDSLQIESGLPDLPPTQPAPAATPTTAVELLAIVLNPDINLRAGPGKEYAVIGRLAKGQEIRIAARNLQGDWLLLAPEGAEPAWVFATLVTLRGDLLSLPVVESQP
jgi:hypothetical protein